MPLLLQQRQLLHFVHVRGQTCKSDQSVIYALILLHIVLCLTAAHHLLGYEGQKVIKCSVLHPAIMVMIMTLVQLLQSIARNSYYKVVLKGALVECVHRSAI